MISALFIKNFALIDELNLSFPTGFSTITGETGAGKSILLGAMQLALGKRADLSQLKNPEKKAIIELEVALNNSFKSFFEKEDIDFEKNSILRREITPSGKSRAFINDSPVSLSQLQFLSKQLIDIHSQQDTLILSDSNYQLKLVDLLAKNDHALKAYQEDYKIWKALVKERKDLFSIDGDSVDKDYLKFAFNELESANLQSGEEDSLEIELKKLSHIEEVKASLFESFQQYFEESTGIQERLASAKAQLENAQKYDDNLVELTSRLESIKLETADVFEEIQSVFDKTDGDPERFRFVEDRFALYQNLLQKHRCLSVEELIEKREELSAKIQLLEGRDERLAELENEIKQKRTDLEKSGVALRQIREKSGTQLAKDIEEVLTDLNMADAQLAIEFETLSEPQELGLDEVKFLFTANKGLPLKPIQKVASGGEMSRLMLAVKAILSKTQTLPTIIFDEIDTGVSGKAALKIAEILKNMGKEMQVIAITHLPQIAAASSNQFVVEKSSASGETRTQIKQISKDSREKEIARLLSGEENSQVAIENAREMLSKHHG